MAGFWGAAAKGLGSAMSSGAGQGLMGSGDGSGLGEMFDLGSGPMPGGDNKKPSMNDIANMLGKQAGANIMSGQGGGGGNHSQFGMQYAKAPDMSQYASINNLRSLMQPHAQRPQPQQDIQVMQGYSNPYIRSLLGG